MHIYMLLNIQLYTAHICIVTTCIVKNGKYNIMMIFFAFVSGFDNVIVRKAQIVSIKMFWSSANMHVIQCSLHTVTIVYVLANNISCIKGFN